MADILPVKIPLPIPRPVMEEVHLGSDHPGINWNIPVPDMADIDLSYPIVGMEWLKQPWYWITGKEREIMEMLSVNIFDIGPWAESIILWAAVVSAIALPFIVVGVAVGSLVRWFRKRYINNDWTD